MSQSRTYPRTTWPDAALSAHDNPYWEQFASIEIDGAEGLLTAARLREPMVRRFGYAIPSAAALAALATWGPIVEIGAGGGYWAALLRARGTEIYAYDSALAGDDESEFTVRWTEVTRGGVDVLSEHSQCTLFLCWPPHESSLAVEALAAYPGQRCVYVGEGPGGCCADDEFFARLDAEWDAVERVALPRWPGIHDSMTLWQRRAS